MSFGGVVSTIPAAYFGMNLSSGMEDVPGMLWPVAQSSLLAGIGMATLVYAYYKFGPKRRYQARLRDMRSLRDLLIFHLDDLDEILEAVKRRGSSMRIRQVGSEGGRLGCDASGAVTWAVCRFAHTASRCCLASTACSRIAFDCIAPPALPAARRSSSRS